MTDLEPYRKHGVLFAERKSTREFPHQRQTLSFTDNLPAEIRSLVYGYILRISTIDRFFELWGPESWDYPQPNRERFVPNGETQNDFRVYASVARSRGQGLGLMRVCKKVHNELTYIFYGQQNFRFTYTNGFSALASWLYTIRPNNAACVRHITVQLPIMAQSRVSDPECAVSVKMWKDLNKRLLDRGMRLPRLRNRRSRIKGGISPGFMYAASVRLAFRHLAAMPNLEKLEILVPESYQTMGMSHRCTRPQCSMDHLRRPDRVSRRDAMHLVEDHNLAPRYWRNLEDLKQGTASPKLEIWLILQHWPGPNYYKPGYYSFPEKMCSVRMECLKMYAQAKRYKIGYARWKSGSYWITYGDETHRDSLGRSSQWVE